MTILEQAEQIVEAQFNEYEKYRLDVSAWGIGFLTRIDGREVHVPIEKGQEMVRQWIHKSRNPE